jgi:hypothetical protein
MARLPRVSLVNVPQNTIRRGNNCQACFASKQDQPMRYLTLF